MFRLLKRVVPGTPPVNTGRVFLDTADGRPKFVDENGLAWALSADGMRDQNLIINGGFDYAQRQVPGTLTTYSQTASRQYTADRWSISNENASIQFRRVDTTGTQQAGLQARFYGEFSKLTSAGKIVVAQPIEGGNCQHLRGRKVRFQVKMKASASKTMRLLLLQLANAGTVDVVPGIVAAAPSGTFVSAFGANSTDPTFGTNLAKVSPDTADNATIANSGLSCSVTTAWQKFGGTFTMPTDFKNLVLVAVTDSQFAAADNFGISEAGLYDGTEVRDWAERMQIAQSANCQRYFAKSFNMDTNPAQNAGIAGAERAHSVAGAVASTMGINFPAMMRAAPSVLVFFNPSAANAFVRNTRLATDASATTAANAAEGGVDVNHTGPAGWAAGDPIAVHFTADAEF